MALPTTLDPWREVIHPAALILPRPSEVEYTELKQSIEARGVLMPLATFVDAKGEHWLLDGVSRLQAMVELDQKVLDDDGRWAVPTTPYYESNGADPYEIALSLNVTRRHLTPTQKREVIRQLRDQRPELSDRAIAKMAGVSPHTVAAERQQQAEEAEEGFEEGNVGEGNGYDPETGEITEADDGVEELEQQARGPQRVEESGKRARGRKQGKAQPRKQAVAEDSDENEPFVGTVLPSAGKAARVAEARRCIKHLKLKVEDLSPRARKVAAA